MSYDVSIEVPINEKMLQYISPSEYGDVFGDGTLYYELFNCGNYTSNVSAMYARAMGNVLSAFHGQTCANIHPLLVSAVEHMTNNPRDYLSLEPENKWGSYEGALEYLRGILEAVSKSPLNARIYISS